MSATIETPDTELTPDLIERVLKLSPESQARLRDLLDEVPDDPDAVKGETRAELQNRWDAIQSGEAKTYTTEEAVAYARGRLRGRKQP